MLYGILNIVLGAFVASPTFISPEKRIQYGVIWWAGIVFFIMGIIGIRSLFINNSLESLIFWLVEGVINLLMVIMLIINLLNKFSKFSKSHGNLFNKILSCRHVIGIVAVIFGAIQVYIIIFYNIILYGILYIVSGTFVVSLTFIPQEKRIQYADVISWVGIVFIIWGILGIPISLSNISLLSTVPVDWILWLVVVITNLLMGIILGINLLNKFMKFPENLFNKILSCRYVIGIIAVIIGAIRLYMRA
jgi:hypothetical protein